MSSRRKQSNPRSLKDVDEATDSGLHVTEVQEISLKQEILRSSSTDNDADEQPRNSPDTRSYHHGEAILDNAAIADGETYVSGDVSNSRMHLPDEANTGRTTGNEEVVLESEEPASASHSADGMSKEFPYACSYCDKAFSKFSYVRDHELVHSDELPYQCEFCHRPFRHKRSRDRHMKLHTGDKNYKCALCDAAFSRSDHLKNHMKSHSNGKWLSASQAKQTDHGSGLKATDNPTHEPCSNSALMESKGQTAQRCQLCKETFVNYYELDEHLRGHAQSAAATAETLPTGIVLPVKPLEYHCTHCAKQSLKQVFASLLALEQHVTHMHTGKGLALLSCPHCEAAFPTVSTLNEHIEREHTKTTAHSATQGVLSTQAPVISGTPTVDMVQKPFVASRIASVSVASDAGRHSSGSVSDLMSCHLCSKLFSTSAEIMSHMLNEHGSQTYRTLSATKIENGTRDISTPLDLSSRSPSNSPVVCQICGDSFSSMALLMGHNQTSHWEMLTSKCNVCSEVISSPHQHLDHMERHYLSTRRHYICRCCKQSFSLVDELQAHLITEHSRKIYKCLLCSDTFHTDVDLKIHLTVEHSNEKKTYKCACCGHDFEDITTWRTHMLHMHIDLVLPSGGLGNAKKEQLHCPYCVKSFGSEAELNIHVLTHQRSFQCSLCEESFPVEYLRDKHMQNEHSRQLRGSDNDSHKPQGNTSQSMVTEAVSAPFLCGICDRVFHSEDVYDEHKRKSHSSVRSWQNRHPSTEKSSSSNSVHVTTSMSVIQTKMFSTACNTCGKAFKTYSELDKHSRVHFGPVSLTCVICDQVFSSLSDMAKHKLQHCKVPNTKPCILCNADIGEVEDYLKHSNVHVESDSTIVCCVCKHRITSQVELDLHAEFHFPKKPTLNCASCKKVCPYFIQLPAQLTENPQFLLCQECLMARKQSTNILLPNRLLPVPPLTPEAKSPRSPPTRHSTSSSSPRSYSRDHKASVSSALASSPPVAVHRCSECNVKYETLEELDNHGCLHKPCATCQKTFRISELVCKLDSYTCVPCDTIPKDLWKCDKCKLTFTREEKYQKHNCIALGDGKACSLCNGRFNHSQLLLRGSKLICKTCDKKLVTCRVCMEAFMHSETHACRLRCEACHQMFNSTSQQVGKPKLCSICYEKQSADEASSELNNRSQSVLTRDKVYQCIKCQKTCESESEIKIHILTYHMNDKTHKCYLCSALFATPAKLQVHLIEHNFAFSERMVCPKCDWSTSEASSLINHCVSEHSVTDRGYMCTQCMQSFFFETELINHLSSHHNGIASTYRPPSLTTELMRRKRSYSSDIRESSDNSVPRIKVIKTEVVSDNDDNDELFCSKCDVEFVSLKHYNNHLKLYHRESTTSCPLCARLYCCQDDLQEHMTSCQHGSRRNSEDVFTNGCSNSVFSPTYGRADSPGSHSSARRSITRSPQNGSAFIDHNSDKDGAAEQGFKKESMVITTNC